jgi:hypothetical protein
MYDLNKKYSESDKQYNLNSFRGQYSDKIKQKDSRLMSPKELLLSMDRSDDKPRGCQKPKLLTHRLPPAFNMISKGHFGEENVAPKKLIVDKQPELLGENEVATHKQLNSYYISYVIFTNLETTNYLTDV